MANPEYSRGMGRVEWDKPVEERPLSLQEQLEKIGQLLEENDENENTIERTLKREQLQEEKDAILSDIQATLSD